MGLARRIIPSVMGKHLCIYCRTNGWHNNLTDVIDTRYYRFGSSSLQGPYRDQEKKKERPFMDHSVVFILSSLLLCFLSSSHCRSKSSSLVDVPKEFVSLLSLPTFDPDFITVTELPFYRIIHRGVEEGENSREIIAIRSRIA